VKIADAILGGLTILVQDLADSASTKGCPPDRIAVDRKALIALCDAFDGDVAFDFEQEDES
jgi:hypothetical protein